MMNTQTTTPQGKQSPGLFPCDWCHQRGTADRPVRLYVDLPMWGQYHEDHWAAVRARYAARQPAGAA